MLGLGFIVVCGAENSFNAVGAVTTEGVGIGIDGVAVATGAGVEA